MLPASVATKLRQEHRWGPGAWIADRRHRTAIEAIFGNVRAHDGKGIQRGWIRLVGLVALAGGVRDDSSRTSLRLQSLDSLPRSPQLW